MGMRICYMGDAWTLDGAGELGPRFGSHGTQENGRG